jgi:glycerophosphoryl diester phosphodiesterase
MIRMLRPAAAALILAASANLASAAPLVIAHRGASGLRPEHTLASYKLAIEQGADFVETDLVMTRDHVLVARHENEIGGTTDVARHPEFASRRTTKTVDGQAITGWFVEDFTLAELKTLRARERLPELRPGNTRYDGQETVPTLQEYLDLIHSEERTRKRRIGIYVETKHPTYFRGIGLPLEEALAATLKRNGYARRSDAAFIESFEVDNLRRLRTLTKVRLVQLTDEEGGPADHAAPSYAAMLTPAGLKTIKGYADAIGPAKSSILPRGSDGASLAPTSLVADAHRAGLLVHPWTFRSENEFLPLQLRDGTDPARHGDAAAEYRLFAAQGVDGVFSDYPGEAASALRGPEAAGRP